MSNWFKIGLLAIVLITSGCSVGDPRQMAKTDIILEVANSRFYPQKWIIPSGQKIHLRIINNSDTQHELVILNGQSPAESDATILSNQFWPVSVEQKETDVTFQAPAMPGEYRLVCSFKDHEKKGEQGVLVVVVPYP